MENRLIIIKQKINIVAFFVLNDRAATEINKYVHTLALHDAQPIYQRSLPGVEDEGQHEDRGRDQGAETEQREDARATEEPGTDARVLRLRLHLDLRQLELVPDQPAGVLGEPLQQLDRKSTRLNSSH